MNKTILDLIIIILLSALSTSLSYSQEKKEANDKVLDKIVAIISNEAILNSEIEEQYFQLKARGIFPRVDERCRIFENLLFQKLLINQAKIDTVEISEKLVVAEVDGRIKEFVKQIGSESALEDYFGKSLPEIKESFMAPVHDQLLSQKMQSEITKDVKITPSEVKKFFQSVPKDSLPLIDATYEISQIEKKPEMTEEEQKQQRKKLNEIRERIVDKGEKFATLAVLYSEDPATSPNGGLMKGASRGNLVSEFASVVFSLEEGEVSDIVQTEYGIHIIKLEKKNGDKVDFRHILLTPKVSSEANVKAKEFLDSIANVIRTDTLTFEQAAMMFSDDEKTRLNGGIMINPYTGTSQFEAKHIEPSVNYTLKNVNPGEISDAFAAKSRSGQMSYKIILLKSRTKAHTINIKDDYQMIQNMALNDKKEKSIREWVNDVIHQTFIKIDDEYKKCKFTMTDWAN